MPAHERPYPQNLVRAMQTIARHKHSYIVRGRLRPPFLLNGTSFVRFLWFPCCILSTVAPGGEGRQHWHETRRSLGIRRKPLCSSVNGTSGSGSLLRRSFTGTTVSVMKPLPKLFAPNGGRPSKSCVGYTSFRITSCQQTICVIKAAGARSANTPRAASES